MIEIDFCRHEIIRYAFRFVPESMKLLLSHTYVCIIFLLMYGTMWALNIRFDTRFFAIASCMLIHLQYTLIEFGNGVLHLVNYYTATKRIQVSFFNSCGLFKLDK